MRTVSEGQRKTGSTTYGDGGEAGSWVGTNKWSDDFDAGLKSGRERN